jgi:DNA-directed RNA polymerase specialized sigma24 family protein
MRNIPAHVPPCDVAGTVYGARFRTGKADIFALADSDLTRARERYRPRTSRALQLADDDAGQPMNTAIAPKPQPPQPAPGPQELEDLFKRVLPKPGDRFSGIGHGLSRGGRWFLLKILAGLSRNDQYDVLQSAMAWCWDRRMSYDLTTTLTTERWFLGAVSNMRQQLFRELEDPTVDAASLPPEHLNDDDDNAPPGDPTGDWAMALEAAERLAAALPEDYRRVAQLEAVGYSRREMIELGVPERTIRDARERIKQLRRLLPDGTFNRGPIKQLPPALRGEVHTQPTTVPEGASPRWPWPSTTAAESVTGVYDEGREMEPAPIDRAIDGLGAMPQHGPDTIDSELPGLARKLLPWVKDPDVRAAIVRTEAERAQIRNCHRSSSFCTSISETEGVFPLDENKGSRSLLDGRRGAQRKERCSK